MDVQRRGLIDAQVRVFNPDEQQENYEELTTNVSMLLMLQDEIEYLIKCGYVVNARYSIGEESPDESSKIRITISENLENAREVDIILPKAYLETAIRRGSADISPIDPTSG
ncbi:MAG: hypothetical protein QG605_1565, partial [Euryarchaeota archaeon]|nr:hypothetical protein [Euryarchaeota archaeon]